MKRIIIFIFLLCNLTSYAQTKKFTYGAKLGFSTSFITSYNVDSFDDYRIGYLVGATTQYQLNDWLGLRFSPDFSSKGCDCDVDINTLSATFDYKFNQVQLPLQLEFRIAKKFLIDIGYFQTFNFNKKLEYRVNRSPNSFIQIQTSDEIFAIHNIRIEPLSTLSSSDKGLLLGIGYQFPKGYSVRIEYAAVLNKLYQRDGPLHLEFLGGAWTEEYSTEFSEIDFLLETARNSFFTLTVDKVLDFKGKPKKKKRRR